MVGFCNKLLNKCIAVAFCKKCKVLAIKSCWITYKIICWRTNLALPLQHEPKTIFFTLEIVPIGNS